MTACNSKSVPSYNTDIETTQESTEDPFSLGDIEVKVPETEPETEPSIETVIATIEDGGLIGVSATGETVYDMGRYGDLGKTFFDSIANSWINWTIETESDLRVIMDTSYGNLHTKEELTQEILAMERDSKPQAHVQETQAVVQETQAPTPETKVALNETQAHVSESQVQQTVPQETQQQVVAQEQTQELPPDVQAMVNANKAWQEAGGVTEHTQGGGTPYDYEKAMEGIVLH